ncbi:peptidoglycan DD-metalloendopeptidase family protein [Erythrobacter sp. SCSIO 43205]|uniref:peptidoglycan DD-metalloendopeptidase family protein n=1 Tax=Erythrobacter sp. SCSIO 43205 TaxID=2779361 RepID=UPI00351D106E
MSNNTPKRTFAERLEGWFPDREFFMRSQGQVRFIKVSSGLQKGAATAAIVLALGWAGSMGVMAWNKYSAEATLASFQHEKAQVASAQQRLEAYGGDIENVVADLEARQEALEAMSQMLPDDIKAVDSNVTDSSDETAKTVEQVGAFFPQARGLAEIEARQLAYVENMTRFADWRAKKAEEALRKLNLDPRAMEKAARAEAQVAMGGPLQVLSSAADGSLDPRFERLGLSLARMSALELALEGVPRVVPAAVTRVTSGFGYRRDPFNRSGAMHNGIDFKGPYNSDIYAAAGGQVTFAGWKGGYGRTVEITHPNGIMTRYAHLARISVNVGEAVDAGATLGGLGSSGRSTGPHLHFEVRINGRAVNPRPFLETAPDVLKEARGSSALAAAHPRH